MSVRLAGVRRKDRSAPSAGERPVGGKAYIGPANHILRFISAAGTFVKFKFCNILRRRTKTMAAGGTVWGSTNGDSTNHDCHSSPGGLGRRDAVQAR